MGRNPPRYSDPHREAMFTLREQGLTGQETADLLRGGWGGLEPITVPKETVNRIVRETRAKRDAARLTELAAQVDASDVVPELIRRMIAIGDRETTRLAEDQAKGKLDPRHFRELVRGLRDLLALTRAAGPAKKGGSSSVPESDEPPSGLAAQLAADEAGPEPQPAPAAIGDKRLSHRGVPVGRPVNQVGKGDAGPDGPDPALPIEGDTAPPSPSPDSREAASREDGGADHRTRDASSPLEQGQASDDEGHAAGVGHDQGHA